MPDSAPPPSVPLITVSIVSHGQWALIEPLMVQLDRFCASHIARVVLTHNIPEAAPDLTGRFRFPVDHVWNDGPHGFGANHNQAFSHCATPWFLVLNPDIRLAYDVLGPLLHGARATSGILAPRILEPGQSAPEPHRALLTPFEILRRRRPSYRAPALPAWIPGLFMLFRREAYAQAGGFDERFFMYCEDFDLCARIRMAGWQLQVDEQLRATHEAQRDSHRSLRPALWHVRSLLRVWTGVAFWRSWWLLRHRA